MAMRPHGLVPGLEHHGTPDLPPQVALPTRHARLTRCVAQQGQQQARVREEKWREGVGQGQDQVARGHGQYRGFAVLPPWDLGEHLTRGAVTMATSILRVPLTPAAGTVCGVPAELRRPADLDGVQHVLLQGCDGMVTTVGLPVQADESGDFPRWSAGRMPGWRTWAGGGRRSHGVTPAWAGVGPRRAGGRTDCGSSPEAAG